MTIDDVEVATYIAYPEYRLFANKLWFSEQMGYKCGPRGVPVPKSDNYIVRPIYNLEGMGLGAEILLLDEFMDIPLGYFWCELFEGEQYTVDWIKDGNTWKQTNTFKAVKDPRKIYKFQKWTRTNDIDFSIPNCCRGVSADVINVEYIGDKAIEVHIRSNPNPVEYDEMVVVWHSSPKGLWKQMQEQDYVFVPAFQNVGEDARLGFFCK